MVEWCLLIKDKYIKLILDKKKIWEVRSQTFGFKEGERIALGNTGSRMIEGFATISEIKEKTVPEMMKHNDKHFANDYIIDKWKNRPCLHAFVLSKVKRIPVKEQIRYPSSRYNQNPKRKLKELLDG